MLEMGGRSSLQREIFSISATMKEGFALCGAAASVFREIPRQFGRRTRQISHIVATTGFQGGHLPRQIQGIGLDKTSRAGLASCSR
ncbi:hypothetical protein [Sinorhizobium medicae]